MGTACAGKSAERLPFISVLVAASDWDHWVEGVGSHRLRSGDCRMLLG
jgi:hypothetical protein